MPSPERENSDRSSVSRVPAGRPLISAADASVTDAPAPVNRWDTWSGLTRMSVACGPVSKARVPPSVSLRPPSAVVTQTRALVGAAAWAGAGVAAGPEAAAGAIPAAARARTPSVASVVRMDPVRVVRVIATPSMGGMWGEPTPTYQVLGR